MMDGKPILSCSTLAVRVDGHEIYTLEGLQEEASEFVGFIADQGAEQCGFCNPGFVMNTIALLRENPAPTDDEDGTRKALQDLHWQAHPLSAFQPVKDRHTMGTMAERGVLQAEAIVHHQTTRERGLPTR